MYRMDEAARNVNLASEESFATAPEPTDDLLAEAARDGDDAAFEQIFERHRRRIARMVGRFFNRRERVEEILQDAFTKAYIALEDYSPQPGSSFVAWLTRIAVNCCYDELRRARRRPESSITEITRDELIWLNARLGANPPTVDAEAEVIARDLA